MNKGRDAFLAKLQGLVKKYNVEPHFFYGCDSEGTFGDFHMSQEEIADMVFDILRHEDFQLAAQEISKTIAEELLKSENGTCDLSNLDAMKWSWRKKE